MKLKKQFENFHDAIKISGSSESHDLRTKRETLQNDFTNKFPVNCEGDDIAINKSELRFIDQGSYKINTVIKNPTGSIDRDVAVIFPLDIDLHSDPRILKKHAKNALEITNRRIPKIKEPCITVGYHEDGVEYMHIDFPMYAVHYGTLYLARGKEYSDNYEWEEADPEGLNEYFLDKLKDNPQLKRIIRYIKKWKMDTYANPVSSNEVPPSIALTLLACKHFVEYKEGSNYDDLTSLYRVMDNILDTFIVSKDYYGEIQSATIDCTLPVTPYSDVFYKMKNSKDHCIKFYKRLKKAVDNLQNACNVDSEHEAAKYVQKVLGDSFEVPPKEASTVASVLGKRENSFG